MEKRGQAAMEFLMTYGWAILAAIIAIGVLAYFGVFSPGKFVQDSYLVNAPFNARGVSLTDSSDQLRIELLNGAGEQVTVSTVAVTNCGSASGWTMAAGNSSIYTMTCTPVLTSGETFRGDITITYTKQGSSLSQQSTGTITARVP